MRWPFGKKSDGSEAASASDYRKMAPVHMACLLSCRLYTALFICGGVMLTAAGGAGAAISTSIFHDTGEISFFLLSILLLFMSVISLSVSLIAIIDAPGFSASWTRFICKSNQSPLRPRMDEEMFEQVIIAQNNGWDLYHTALAIQKAAPKWLDHELVLDCDSVVSCRNESMHEKLDYKSMTEIMKLIDVMAALPAAKPEDSMVDKTYKSLREIAPRDRWQAARDKVCRQHVDAQRVSREAKTNEATATAGSVLDAMETIQSDELSARLSKDRVRLELEAQSAAAATAKEKADAQLKSLGPAAPMRLI